MTFVMGKHNLRKECQPLPKDFKTDRKDDFALTDEKVRSLAKTLLQVSDSLERAKIADYVGLLNRPGRLMYLNAISGLFRGLGMAAGFTVLGALLIYVLTRSFVLNLPIVGNFLGELVWIIQQYLKVR